MSERPLCSCSVCEGAAQEPYWTVQVNDVIGGFVVTNHPKPLSEHGHWNLHVVACECVSEGMATLIANLLNTSEEGRTDA